jgi:hypothetical protein
LHTQDEWPPLATKNPPVANKNSSISAPVATLATLATEKQDIHFPGDFSENFSASSHPKIDDKIPLIVSYKKSGQSGQGGQSRTNPGEFYGHQKSAGGQSGQSRTNPGVSPDPEVLREYLWHRRHGERIAPGLCAGCRGPITESSTALDLADGNRVHLDPDYRCLIAWGGQWRSAARAALAAKTLQPPREE